MTADTIIFAISAIVAIFGAAMMVFQRNPIASVLYLIVSLLAQAVLYVQLGAAFVGAVLIIVYSGAILVLFLFVIMMLNLRGTEDLGSPLPPIKRFTKYLISILIFGEFVMIIRGSMTSDAAIGMLSKTSDTFGSVEEVAILLYTRYLYPFELTSILLLSAIVGAVIIAKRETNDDVIDEPEMEAPKPISQSPEEGK